jgi:hypothetical protein
LHIRNKALRRYFAYRDNAYKTYNESNFMSHFICFDEQQPG